MRLKLPEGRTVGSKAPCGVASDFFEAAVTRFTGAFPALTGVVERFQAAHRANVRRCVMSPALARAAGVARGGIWQRQSALSGVVHATPLAQLTLQLKLLALRKAAGHFLHQAVRH